MNNVDWTKPIQCRDNTRVTLVPGVYKFGGKETRAVIRHEDTSDLLLTIHENGFFFEDEETRYDIINIPPTTQDAWVVKYADGSKRVLLTEPADAPLIDNPKLIKATLTYYDTP